MELSDYELRDLLDFAIEVAKTGGQVVMRHYRHSQPWRKADGSLVSRADIEAEEAMVARLQRADARAQILGEELGGADEGIPGQQWIIDPIDGTSWFALGLPIFGVLIALVVDRDPVLGVIHCPALAETVSAARGLGCWHQMGVEPPVRGRVARCDSIQEARLSAASLPMTDAAGSHATMRARITPIIRDCALFVTAGDCVQHALVATGRLHAAIDPLMRPWDSAAVIPCILEAGGFVGAIHETSKALAFAGSLISASSERLLNQVTAATRTT